MAAILLRPHMLKPVDTMTSLCTMSPPDLGEPAEDQAASSGGTRVTG